MANKKSTSKKKVGEFVIFLAGLIFFIIGWIKFFEVPYGFTFDRTMSVLTIIVGGFLLKIYDL
jgi:hypothetical protein